MLPVTGYADRWSVAPGESIRFMISVVGDGRYRARVSRVLCGDPNPSGPGFRDVAMPTLLDCEHQGKEQPIRLGSWVKVPVVDLGHADEPVCFVATIWPTRLSAGRQAVSHWRSADRSVAVTLGISPRGAFASVVTRSGRAEVTLDTGLTERAWHDIACCVDLRRGVLDVAQAPRHRRLDRRQAIDGDSKPTIFRAYRLPATCVSLGREGPYVDLQSRNIISSERREYFEHVNK